MKLSDCAIRRRAAHGRPKRKPRGELPGRDAACVCFGFGWTVLTLHILTQSSMAGWGTVKGPGERVFGRVGACQVVSQPQAEKAKLSSATRSSASSLAKISTGAEQYCALQPGDREQRQDGDQKHHSRTAKQQAGIRKTGTTTRTGGNETQKPGAVSTWWGKGGGARGE